MTTTADVLISVAEPFVAAFRSGAKTAEVRRRRLNVCPHTRIWIYTKLPIGRVELVGRVQEVVAAAPLALWKKHGPRTGLTRKEFFDYVSGCETAYVILISDILKLSTRPTLSELRRSKRGFQPPQFAKIIENGDALHRILSLAAAT